MAWNRKQRYGKYNARKVVTPEGVFDSTGEHRRWCELIVLARSGHIRELKRQVEYPIYLGETLVCKYVADFVYWENSVEVVEDFKGVVTDEFKLKAKLFCAFYGKPIRVTTNKGWTQYPKAVKNKKGEPK